MNATKFRCSVSCCRNLDIDTRIPFIMVSNLNLTPRWSTCKFWWRSGGGGKDRCHCDSHQRTAPVLSHDCYRQARKCSEKCGKRKSDSNEKRVPVTAADSDKCWHVAVFSVTNATTTRKDTASQHDANTMPTLPSIRFMQHGKLMSRYYSMAYERYAGVFICPFRQKQ